MGQTGVLSDGRVYYFSPSGSQKMVEQNGVIYEKNNEGTFKMSQDIVYKKNSQRQWVPLNPGINGNEKILIWQEKLNLERIVRIEKFYFLRQYNLAKT